MNILKWLANKWPHYDITKKVDGIETLYLRRWFIFRSKYFNIYLHHIARPDEDPDPHDHPWSFISIRLRGGYFEQVYMLNDKPTRLFPSAFYNKAPGIGFRTAETIHQIEYVQPNTWTLVLTGPDRRDWGFVKDDGTREGKWIFWREYLNVWEKVNMD